MTTLHNRISHKELKEKLLQDNTPRTTISFYRYLTIHDPVQFRNDLFLAFQGLGVLGRIYVAFEGINAQISVPSDKLDALKEYLDSVEGLRSLRLNIAVDDNGKSFWVLKIKVRDKIVADGIQDPAFNMENRGRYVDAEAFNELATQPNTILVDMRNHYEYEVGHFRNALEVPSDTFREQLPMATDMLKGKEDTPVIMYCTGGIRCEKASAWMMHQGFKQVYHLEGGIIHYANQVKEKGLPNLFLGKNFVFDDRLGERIGGEIISQCHQCGEPADTHTNCANEACHLLFIQCEKCAAVYQGCCCSKCKETIQLPVEVQKEKRKGINHGQHIFNKSKKLRPKPSL